MSVLRTEDWGLIAYEQAQTRQYELVERVKLNPQETHIGFCTHPPVATFGRKAKPEDVFAWTGQIIEVQRGGRVTYHGPSQVICYPIFHLHQARQGFRSHDVQAYMRWLETSVIGVLAQYGVTALAQPPRELQSDEREATGVWVGARKICSIGIGVRGWVAFHGLAFNLDCDDQAFRGLNPCGYSSAVMISLEQVLGRRVDRAELIARLRVALEVGLRSA